MAMTLDKATLATIHDLEAEVDHLTGSQISLEASLRAQTEQLDRERDTIERLTRERDYYKGYAVGLATRLHICREMFDALEQQAVLAGSAPAPIPPPKDPLHAVETAVAELGKKFGANGAAHEDLPT